jgi:mono/diheme cytochrome c family protein
MTFPIMIPTPMRRTLHAILLCLAAGALSLFAASCGTEKIAVPTSDATLRAGAVLFNQRCSGCHSLSPADARGSAANVQTREYENGPNFNVRCERPVTRILYAIANGGFSGQIMPQNIVVGRQAEEVAEFVAKYAGRQAPKVSGLVPCSQQPIGSIPGFFSASAGTSSGG